MKRFATWVLFTITAIISLMASETYTVTTSSQLNVRNKPIPSGSVIGRMEPGAAVSVEDVENDWARINYNGKTGYVSAKYLQPCGNMSVVSSGNRPGPGQHVETTSRDDLVRNFSTNRIMEKLPDFGFLRGKAGNPDVWFWLAFGLICGCFALRMYDRFDSDWSFYAALIAFVGASVCEVLYLLSSEEPLSFFSPDINSLFKAISSFILLVVLIMEQFHIFITLLVRIQRDADRGFMASYTSFFVWGGVIGLLGYFYTLIIENTPYTWWWPVVGVILCIPIIAMLISSFSRGGWKSAVLGIPVYIIGAIPLLLCLSLVAVVAVFLLLTLLMLSLIGYLIQLGEGELRYHPLHGYYYVFPDGSIKGASAYF